MKSFNWIEISEKYNEGSRDVKFGFLNIQSSFATIWILFEVQKWLWWCCIVTATVQYELRYWYCAFRRSASFSLLVFGRRRTTVASSKCPIINWLQLTLLCSLGLPLLPLPRVGLQRRRLRVGNLGMISLSHMFTHAALTQRGVGGLKPPTFTLPGRPTSFVVAVCMLLHALWYADHSS